MRVVVDTGERDHGEHVLTERILDLLWATNSKYRENVCEQDKAGLAVGWLVAAAALARH